MKDLREFLKENGFAVDFPCNGTFYRFDRNGTLNGWFIGRTYTIHGTAIQVVRFGDWRTGESYKWQTEGEFSPEELAQIAAHVKEAEGAEKAERAKQQLEVAELAEAKWRLCHGRKFAPNPYLKRKGFDGEVFFGCGSDGENLLVPCRDIDGKLWGLQKIQPDGGKYFTPGQKIKGCFHVVGLLDDSKEPESVCIAEGVATAASIFLSTGIGTLVAFNAGNLQEVAQAVRGRWQSTKIIICGDDDRWTSRPGGAPWNPGREAATKAARACNGEAIFPRFLNTDSHPTDYNDLHILEGLSAIREQIEGRGAGSVPEIQVLDAGGSDLHFEAWMDSLEPLDWPMGGKNGDIPKRPSDQAVVNHLLEWYGENLRSQDGGLFVYVGTHWRIVGTPEEGVLIRQLQHTVGGCATFNQLRGMLLLLTACTPPTPFDIFKPRYVTANFENGTLHLVRDAGFKWTKEFRGHEREDFLLNVIPLKYEPEKAEKNEEFLAMLERIFANEEGKADKIRAVRQMYGSMLCAIRPHLFLLHGPAGGGKSSLIIPASRLVHQDNICSVEPNEFKGFLMESMVGKLVNIVADIKLTEPIDDNHIKKIEDRRPVRIDRKFKTPLHAPLPPIHIFGANGIPPTLDGSSGAHDRRWTFIRLDKHKAEPGRYQYDFGNWVYEQSPVGVLNFALEGLEDLLASNGHYFSPAEGREALREWQLQSDPVGLFFEDAVRGEVDQNSQIKFDDAERIRTIRLWECFKKWVESSGGKFHWFGKHRFYAAVREKGYLIKTVNGSQYFAGIGQGVAEEGRF